LAWQRADYQRCHSSAQLEHQKDDLAVAAVSDLITSRQRLQTERQKRIAVGGGHSKFCPRFESGVDNQYLYAIPGGCTMPVSESLLCGA
jgi:hypothetical protein